MLINAAASPLIFGRKLTSSCQIGFNFFNSNDLIRCPFGCWFSWLTACLGELLVDYHSMLLMRVHHQAMFSAPESKLTAFRERVDFLDLSVFAILFFLFDELSCQGYKH